MGIRRGLLLALAIVGALVVVELVSGGRGRAERQAPRLPAAVLVPPRLTVSDLRGRPALVVFWASWCEPCRQEAPQFARFARSLHGRPQLVAVDWNDGLAAARAFVREYGWSFPVLRDPSGAVGERYGVLGLPTTFVLDRRGRIVQVLRGPQSASRLRRAIQAAS